MQLECTTAVSADAEAIAALRNDAAQALVDAHGTGHWGGRCTADAIARALTREAGRGVSLVLLAREAGIPVGTLHLVTKKPWAIDATRFPKARRPLHLIDMAVAPARQRQGIGRWLIDRARDAARAWPADAIRLDAYDAPAGAGAFYERCGFTPYGGAVYRGVPLLYFEWRVEAGEARHSVRMHATALTSKPADPRARAH